MKHISNNDGIEGLNTNRYLSLSVPTFKGLGCDQNTFHTSVSFEALRTRTINAKTAEAQAMNKQTTFMQYKSEDVAFIRFRRPAWAMNAEDKLGLASSQPLAVSISTSATAVFRKFHRIAVPASPSIAGAPPALHPVLTAHHLKAIPFQSSKA